MVRLAALPFNLPGGREGRGYVGSLQPHAVRVAPGPVLVRLEGLDDGMVRGVVVFGRVPVGRGIAASHMAAGQAQPEMDPPASDLETFLATIRGARLDPADPVQMRAASGHGRARLEVDGGADAFDKGTGAIPEA